MFRIAVLVSGTGTNLKALIDAAAEGILDCAFSAVISDRLDAGGLILAEEQGIRTFVFSEGSVSDRILKTVRGNTDLIICAGFLSILKGQLLQEFRNRIINIHPSLIPSFCGKGMYGIKVHEEAINYGVKVSGCTVHFVENGVDSGPVIIQRVVSVQDGDSAEDLQKRILKEEHAALVEAVKVISEGRIRISRRKVIIKNPAVDRREKNH